MKRRFFSILLALLLCLSLLPVTASAVTEYDLWVGGVQVTSANAGNITAAINAAGGTAAGTASYDSGILTLEDFSYTGEGYNYGTDRWAVIYTSNTNINIDVTGSNSIVLRRSSTETNDFVTVLYATDVYAVNITGSGSLLLKAEKVDNKKYIYGARIGEDTALTIDGAEVQFVAETGASSYSRGIFMYEGGTITVKNGGKLECSGGNSAVYANESTDLDCAASYTVKAGDSIDGAGAASVTSRELQGMSNYKYLRVEELTYDVTVTPGANMTLSSGSASQTGLTGAMTNVVYTADDGYYFPTDYVSSTAPTSLSITRNSDTQLTISGTPTADETIVLPAATEYLYPLWVGGVQVKGSNRNDITAAINAAAGSNVASGTASLSLNAYGYTDDKPLHYDLTLTLTDFAYTGKGYEFETGKYAAVYFKGNGERAEGFYPKFYADGELIIDVNGECSITQQLDNPSASASECYGIHAYSGSNRDTGLYFQNNGSLTVSVGNNGTKDIASGIFVYGHCYADTASLTCVGPVSGATTSSGISLYSSTRYLSARNGGTITADGADYAVRDLSTGSSYSLIQYGTADYSLIAGTNADGSGATGYTGETSAEGSNTNVNTKNLTSYKYVAIKQPSYNVTVTPGANMTLSSGTESQTGLTGAMTDVVYTADEGYYFPTDYAVASVNGITVTRDSYTQITVSGTPTADAAITLTAAQPAVPSGITVSTLGSDGVYLAGVPGEEYVIAPRGTATPDWTGAKVEEDGYLGFGGLTEATEYTIFARVAETDDHLPGAAVTQDVTTYISAYGFSGEPIVGGTLSAPIDDVYDQTGVSYQWYLDGTAIAGETGAEYVVQAGDAGKALTVMPLKNGAPLWDEAYAAGEAHFATVNFYKEYKEDPNDLELLQSVGNLKFGDTVQAPDSPTMSGYDFAGWQEGVPGAFETVAFPMTVEYDTDLYAAWITPVYDDSTPSASSTPAGTVTIPASKNGSVTVSPKNPTSGSKVTVTPRPDAGYEVASVIVKDASGKEIAATQNTDGSYTFTQPSGRVTIEAAFKEIEGPAGNPFTDVAQGAYYHDAVQWAVANGITEGTSETTFSPNATCTRAQMVTFLWRAAGAPEPTAAENPFDDLDESAYYYKAILWAYENGITAGTGAATFSPDGKVTRAQSVTFLFRALGGRSGADMPFEDVADSAYYYDAVLWAAENGVTEGTGETTFSPESDCLRAQIITFLYRAYEGE